MSNFIKPCMNLSCIKLQENIKKQHFYLIIVKETYKKILYFALFYSTSLLNDIREKALSINMHPSHI